MMPQKIFKKPKEMEIWEGTKNVRIPHILRRSEERRVGKECRSRWSPYH